MAGIVALVLVARETYPLVANVYSSNEVVHPATGPMMGSILLAAGFELGGARRPVRDATTG